MTALPKEDTREKRGWWAPGAYYCKCVKCDEQFIGDKRALWCADCAYKTPMFPNGECDGA
jgi:hypothetical protein